MKLLATAIFAGMLAFGTAACAKEEPKKATPAATQAAPASKLQMLRLEKKLKSAKL